MLKKILLKNPCWDIKKTDFNSPEIKESLAWVEDQAREAKERVKINPKYLYRIIS